MTEVFEAITFEVFISSSWVNITTDVLHSPEPTWNMGIMGNGGLDRIGDAEMLKFSLDNSEKNSVSLIGYYTPGHPNCKAGWGTGIPVRLSFQYEGVTYYKYYGLIAPDGLQTDPGLLGARTVSVTAEGFMALADRHILELIALQTNKTIVEAVPYVLGNMPVQPLAVEYGTPVYTFPTVFDTITGSTSATAELLKLALSEFGYVYTKGDKTGGQTLVVECKSDRTNAQNTTIPIPSSESGFFLLETGDYLLLQTNDKLILEIAETIDFDNIALEGVKVTYGANLANWITGTTYPRVVDASATTVLFETQRRIYVASGATVENIRGRYRDPNGAATYINGTDMVAPVAGTDYIATANEDGTGTVYTSDIFLVTTYGSEQVDYSITNTGAVGAWVWIQARGKGIYNYDPITKVFTDTDSKNQYGKFPLNLDMAYQDNPLVIESIGAQLLAIEKQPYLTVNGYPILANRDSANMFAFLILEPGSRARFAEPVTGYDNNAFINGYEAKLVSGKYVIWSPILKTADDTNYWVLDTGELDSTTILDT